MINTTKIAQCAKEESNKIWMGHLFQGFLTCFFMNPNNYDMEGPSSVANWARPAWLNTTL